MTNWQKYNDSHIFHFPVLKDVLFEKADRIHPLKQRKVNEINQSSELKRLCDDVIIFGSAVSMKCHRFSDLDIAVTVINDDNQNRNRIGDILRNITNYNCDIIWLNDRLNSNAAIYDRIEKGVKII